MLVKSSAPLILCVLVLSAIMLACGAGQTPVAPAQPGNQLSSATPGTGDSDRVLWGLYNVNIDPATMKADVTPIRGAEFTANVTKFMQPPASPTNMVSFTVDSSSDPSTGYFVVDVTLKHPFPGLNQYNGFDVRGICMGDGSDIGSHDSSVVWNKINGSSQNLMVMNADGLTRWWNWPEFLSYNSIFGATQGKLAPPYHPTATINGYKYFAEGLGLEDSVATLDPTSRGFFPTTIGASTRRYQLQFVMDTGKPVFKFNYAVDASWEQPDPSFAPTYPKEAFPLSANCQEAFNVAVADAGSNAFYVDPSTKGGDFKLDVEVFDWQGGAKGNVPGEISGIWLEGDVLGGATDVMAAATVLPGSTINSAIYEVTITPSNLTGTGDFQLLGTVESASPDTYVPQVTGGSSFTVPPAHLAAYFTCKVTVTGIEPGPAPVVTGIDPDNGYPDCTPEHVTVTGSNFQNGSSFFLHKTGETDIDATGVTFIDANTLEGDLDLLGALPGTWDVTVHNPDGKDGTLANGFTINQVLFVDGDNAGDPSQNGSETHPFDTIQKGIDAAASQSNQHVLVDQSTSDYAPFVLKNNSYVVGCNWNGGTGWPTVNNINVITYVNGVNNTAVEGLFFNMTISSGDRAMYFNGGDYMALRGCKFSGIATTIISYFVFFNNSQHVEIDGCEFTKIYERGSDTDWRSLMALKFEGTNHIEVHRSEFHDMGYDVPDAGAYGDSVNLIRVGYGSQPPHNVDLHNLLIYNIFDKTNCVRPSPNPDPQNAMTVLSLSNINSFDWVGDFYLYNITVDDIRNADPPATTIMNAGHCNASYMGMVGGDDIVWKNNIASNIIPTDDVMTPGNSSYWGWWVDGYVQPGPTPFPMDYSDCFNIGKPLPNGANSWQWTSGYVNQVMAGTGSYQNYQDIDPQYDMTSGATFYHPTNVQISQGADDGSEMGAFGGPEGDWVPLSQQ